MKKCNKCNIIQNYSEFYINTQTKDKYTGHCKNCDKVYRSTPEYKARRSKYLKDKKDIIREKRRVYKTYKKSTDNLYKLTLDLRKRTAKAFKVSRWDKNSKTKTILGCEFKKAFNHIESQFVEGMSWNNRHEWHIDHIIPLASAKTEEELIKLCHYTNLQPLWAEDNLKKGCKII